MEPIAVVGFSFKLPQGIDDAAALWENLEAGRNLMTPWPDSRANVDAFYSSDISLKNVVCLICGALIRLKCEEHADIDIN